MESRVSESSESGGHSHGRTCQRNVNSNVRDKSTLDTNPDVLEALNRRREAATEQRIVINLSCALTFSILLLFLLFIVLAL